MIHIEAARLAELLDPPSLIEALGEAFREQAFAPERRSYSIERNAGAPGTLLLMPAWRNGRHIALKVVTFFGDNAQRSLPTVQAIVMLFDASTGRPLATLDGTELTLRRTAAASALAAKYLARSDATRLLMVGTGQLAPHVIAAHACVRPIREVRVWGRDLEKAQRVTRRFENPSFNIEAIEHLDEGVAWADVISCATLATEPLIQGTKLKPGQHLDLIGAFTPTMREADLDAVQRSEIFVDTCTGALAESGELIQAFDAGVITRNDVRGELSELARGTVAGRSGPDAITLFKSVGTALEDLAAAELALARCADQRGT